MANSRSSSAGNAAGLPIRLPALLQLELEQLLLLELELLLLLLLLLLDELLLLLPLLLPLLPRFESISTCCNSAAVGSSSPRSVGSKPPVQSSKMDRLLSIGYSQVGHRQFNQEANRLD